VIHGVNRTSPNFCKRWEEAKGGRRNEKLAVQSFAGASRAKVYSKGRVSACLDFSVITQLSYEESGEIYELRERTEMKAGESTR
jgi:hypothetical protein